MHLFCIKRMHKDYISRVQQDQVQSKKQKLGVEVEDWVYRFLKAYPNLIKVTDKVSEINEDEELAIIELNPSNK